MLKAWKLGSAEMTAETGVALGIVAAMLVGFIAVVLILQYERGCLRSSQ
jgi:multidrug efflux pump subunit AcrB